MKEIDFSSLPPEKLEQLSELIEQLKEYKREELGDGKATFLEPMTDEEYAKMLHDEDQGWRAQLTKWGLVKPKDE